MLRPIAVGLVGESEFVPEAMSASFVARSQFEHFLEDYPDYYIKFAALNPRNPANLADPLEATILKSFQNDPELTEWQGKIIRNGKEYISIAKPFRFTKKCIRCHGKPEDAPQSLRLRYGDTNGFGMQVGDVTMYSVGLPIQVTYATVVDHISAGGIPIFFLMVGFLLFTAHLFERLVSSPLNLLKKSTKKVAAGDFNHISLGTTSEFSDLAVAFNKMASSLQRSLADLKTSEKCLKDTQKIAKLGSWSWDVTKNKLWWSDETYRLFGFMPGDQTAFDKFIQSIHPEDKERVQLLIDQAVEDGTSLQLEYRIILPDGEVRYLAEESETMLNEKNGSVRRVGSVQDITRLIVTQKALEKSEERFELAARGSNNGLWDWPDVKSDDEWWSEQWYQLLGYENNEMKASHNNFVKLLHPDDRPRLEQELAHHFSTRQTFDMEYRLKTKSGEYKWFRGKGMSVWNDAGDPVRMSGSVEDIDARKAAERNLKKVTKKLVTAKEEWEKTFDTMDDIITIQDKNMIIVRANKAAHDAFQVAPGELTGKYCYDVFRQANHPCSNCPELLTLKEATTHGATITHENLGKIFHVTSSPIVDEDGEFTHILHIAKDITERKKMEDELLHAHKMEAIGTLAGGIAHDFNNILTAILGYAEIATKQNIPPESPLNNHIAQIIKAGNRAKELVKQILTFSRKGQESQQLILPSSIIKEALKLMRASLPTTIEMQEEIAPDCGAIIANPTNIHQVLVNLCTNAFHAIQHEKGVISVKLTQVELTETDVIREAGVPEGSFVELTVRDTGTGMDKETIEHIFEPYFTTKDVTKGSGMGLALVHGIVYGCGGFIKVESELGQGSAFYVYLPAIREEIEEFTEEEQESLPKGDERILVVDDEEVIVGMYQETLKELGYTVTAHCSSEKTFKEFKTSPGSFDLVITDQTMPNLPGSELAKKILQIRPDIPIILCTGFSSVVSEEEAKEIGIKRFVMKPVSGSDLAIAVREVLNKCKQQS